MFLSYKIQTINRIIIATTAYYSLLFGFKNLIDKITSEYTEDENEKDDKFASPTFTYYADLKPCHTVISDLDFYLSDIGCHLKYFNFKYRQTVRQHKPCKSG